MAYPLIPSRALLHPAWLASLAVLALNDHVLKGAEILPAALTGKLSDVAGLLVAPLLLAVVLRVRRRSTWLACHVAVGAVFAAIQLSPVAAEGVSTVMGLVGFPWIITMDASDLWTLPMLALSAWGFVPAMRRSAAGNTRRSAEVGVAAVGLLCSAATSSPNSECANVSEGNSYCDPDWDDEVEQEPPPLAPFDADLYIHNATGVDQVVRLRPLRDDVQIDCGEIGGEPGALLRSSLFGSAQSWTVPADTNVPVFEHAPGHRPCYAAWAEADALSPVILFWTDGSPVVRQVAAQGRPGLSGELVLSGSAEQGLRLAGDPDLMFAPSPREPKDSGTCAAQLDADRVGWSEPVPWGSAQVEAVEPGVDGCLAVDLMQGEDSRRWYLCVPQSSFGFDAGDEIHVQPLTSFDTDGFEIVTVGEQGEHRLPMLTVSAGAGVPVLEDLDVAALPVYGCELNSEATCGSAEREMTVVVGGSDLPAAELWVGPEPTLVEGTDRSVELTLMHAQERFALDAECAQGSNQLGPDIELVIAQFPERS